MLRDPRYIADGFYRLVKWQEDGNPVFPSKDTVVELRAGKLINLSTGRSWPLRAIGQERSLFGPLSGPYDPARLRHLPRINLARTPATEASTQTVPGASITGMRLIQIG